MNRPRFQFSVRLALLMMTVAAVGAYWLRPRPVDVEIVVDGYTNEVEYPSNNPYVAAHVRVTNVSPNAIWYQAVSDDHPDFSTSQRRGTEWQDSGYSVTPTQWHRLQRKESFIFLIPLYDDANALKVGLTFYGHRRAKQTFVWSDEFAVKRPHANDRIPQNQLLNEGQSPAANTAEPPDPPESPIGS